MPEAPSLILHLAFPLGGQASFLHLHEPTGVGAASIVYSISIYVYKHDIVKNIPVYIKLYYAMLLPFGGCIFSLQRSLE